MREQDGRGRSGGRWRRGRTGNKSATSRHRALLLPSVEPALSFGASLPRAAAAVGVLSPYTYSGARRTRTRVAYSVRVPLDPRGGKSTPRQLARRPAAMLSSAQGGVLSQGKGAEEGLFSSPPTLHPRVLLRLAA